MYDALDFQDGNHLTLAPGSRDFLEGAGSLR
jgi:hypothetical protein